jgi:hypothetical protein
MGGVHVAQIAFGMKPGKEENIECMLHNASPVPVWQKPIEKPIDEASEGVNAD